MTAPQIRATERFEQARLPMAALSLDGVVLLANGALCRLARTTPDRLAGRPVAELVVPDQARDAVDGVLRSARAGVEGGEVHLEVAGGAELTLSLHCAWSLMRDGSGSPWYVTVVCVDETERLAAEQALLASEERWRALLRNSTDLTWTADDSATVTWVTPHVTSRLGFPVDQVVGRRAFDFVLDRDRPAFRVAWDRVVSGASRQEAVECRLQLPGGQELWVRQTLTDMRTEPAVGALVGNVVDISREKAHQALEEGHQARFRGRFEQSSLPQLELGLDGTIVLANDALCELVGRSREELLGRPPTVLDHPDERGDTDAQLRAVLAGGAASTQVERLVAGPSGAAIPMMIYASALRRSDGTTLGASSYLLDLTELRESERRRHRQQELHDAYTRLASDLALVTDAEGTLLYVSPAVSHVFGYESEDVLLQDGWAFLHPDDHAAARALVAAVISDGGTRTQLLRVRAADGSWRWVEETVTNLLDSSVGGLVCNLRDVTERVEAERALRASELTYRTLAETAEEGIWAVAPDGVTLFANGRLASMLGVPLPEVYARNALDLLGPAADDVRGRLTSRSARGVERYEVGYRHPDGAERRLWVSASPLPAAQGVPEGSLAMVSDVTDVRRAEQELRVAALQDGLTGLPNRTLLIDRLGHALARSRATAVLFVDLDHFKMVNDSLGHGVGDGLLLEVASRLQSAVRPHDTVARFGGDEFVIVCEELDVERATRLAHDVLRVLSEPFDLGPHCIDVGASIGIASSDGASAEDVLRWADTAMHAAKAAGRARVRVFDRSLAEEVEQRYALGADLRQALRDDTIDLHYQPVVDLGTGEVVGMEALARWQHPEHGAVPPTRFVAVAEMTGAAHDLDRWVVRRALRDAASLHAAGVLPTTATVAVNLSARTVSHAVLDDVRVLVDQAGLRPEQVVLEITETAIMQDADDAVRVLRRLRDQGFRIAVDDFGTGYSSLAYLRDLPISSLKIDRSFVADITTSGDALAIVASIVDLARAVSVGVVAEGVETAEQAALLRDMGCTTGQGWLWSRAVPVDELRSGAWLRPFGVTAPAPSPALRGTAPEALPEHGVQRLLDLHRSGASLATIAAALNSEGFRTPSGLRWHHVSVARVVAGNAYREHAGSSTA